MAKIACSKRRDPDQTALRSGAAGCSTYETQAILPHIDVHCHVFGASLIGNPITEQHLQAGTSLVKFAGGPAGATVSTAMLALLYGVRLTDTGRFVEYSLSRELRNAPEVLRGIPTDDEHVDGGAGVPLLLDMGFTPQRVGFKTQVMRPFAGNLTTEKKANKAGGYSARECPEYYLPDHEYIWFPRGVAALERTIDATSAVAMQFPGQFWPFVPFDPRRPNALPWVIKAIRTRGFVGVKLYSRCGWMPLNNQRIHGRKGGKLDERLQELYKYCSDNDLPLLNHTSPTGFPPDGYVVFPRAYETELNVVTQPEDSLGEDFPPYVWPAERPGSSQPNLPEPGDRKQCIRFGLARAASYCHYIQKTTSPYAWEAVLREHPKLRLCLAHSGGEVAVYCRYRGILDGRFSDEELASLRKKLHDNPMVAAGKDFAGASNKQLRDSLFLRLAASLAYVAHSPESRTDANWAEKTWEFLTVSPQNLAGRYAQRLLDGATSAYTDMRRDVEVAIDHDKRWQTWLSRWRKDYPEDWTTKIIQMEAQYENVFSDIAYISGEKKKLFCALVDLLVDDARGTSKKQDGKVMKRKHMIGTDWYMTELDGMSSGEFWKRVCKEMPDMPQPPGFPGPVPKPRDPEKEKTATLPAWWPDVNQYYQDRVSTDGDDTVPDGAPVVSTEEDVCEEVTQDGAPIDMTLTATATQENRENEADAAVQGDTVWERWASKNALDFLNLQPRLAGRGMSTLEQFYDGTFGVPKPASTPLPAATSKQIEQAPCLRSEAQREQWGRELRQEMGWPEDGVPRLILTKTEFEVEDQESYNIIAEHYPDEKALTIDFATHHVDENGDVLVENGKKQRSAYLRGSKAWPKILEYFGSTERISKFKGGYADTNMISFNRACASNGNDLELAVLEAHSGQAFAQAGFTANRVTITKLIRRDNQGNLAGGSTLAEIEAARQFGPDYEEVYFEVQ